MGRMSGAWMGSVELAALACLFVKGKMSLDVAVAAGEVVFYGILLALSAALR